MRPASNPRRGIGRPIRGSLVPPGGAGRFEEVHNETALKAPKLMRRARPMDKTMCRRSAAASHGARVEEEGGVGGAKTPFSLVPPPKARTTASRNGP